MKRSKRKVAVVLSGGGAKGAYEAGALSSIVKKTQAIHVLTGASIGAINAAVFAWEYEQSGDLHQAANVVKSTWLDLGELFEFSLWRILGAAFVSYLKTGSPVNFSAFVDNSKIQEKIKELIPEQLRISDLKKIELAINATCLTTGKTVSFTRDNDAYLGEAVLASSSLPLIFPTQKIKESYYIDGGVFNNTPLRDAIVAQATDIFVVELKPKTKELYLKTIWDQSDFTSVFQVGSRLMELITDKIMYEDLKNARKVNEIIAVINALETAGRNSEVVERLKKSIGYKKDGKVKRHVNLHEIAPTKRLDPPGTLGFDKKDAIKAIIRLGELDTDKQLGEVLIQWEKEVS